MEEVAGHGAPPSQPPARSTPSPAAPDLEPSASATVAAASTSVDRPSRTTQPTAPAQGKFSGPALSIGPVPGAMPNMKSREAAAPPSAAPPRSFFRSTFARCAGEEQEQQAADAADAFSIGPQPSSLHGTRRPRSRELARRPHPPHPPSSSPRPPPPPPPAHPSTVPPAPRSLLPQRRENILGSPYPLGHCQEPCPARCPARPLRHHLLHRRARSFARCSRAAPAKSTGAAGSRCC